MKYLRRRRMDYERFKPDKSWVIKETAKIIFVSLSIGYLFYGRIIFAVFVLPIGYIFWKRDRQMFISERKKILGNEFKDMITSLSGNLNAGCSLERAFYKTCQDLYNSGIQYQYIIDELKKIIHGLECNTRVEDLIMDLATRSGVGDIKDFAKLITTTKIYGGNMVAVIRQTVSNLSEKYMVEEEIETVISAKKLEGKIMLLMPFLIVLYMKLTNKEYMNVIYESTLGNVLMTTGLIIVLAAGLVIDKIVKIEV